ncbi:YihY/virulence factor BrkB family protein, partial [Streptomyces sp. 12297]
MQPANETPERPPGMLHRARALYRNVSKRKMAWLLLKDTVNSCIEYRILGLAAEAAFFTLLSLPPLFLGLLGLLGYVDNWTDTTTVQSIEENILGAVGTVLSDRGVNDIARPLLDDVTRQGRPDIISLGFAFALWSGSRAVNVFIDTITVMYGLDGHRGIVKTRLLAFLLYVVALVIGAVVLPLMVVGPDAVVQIVPWGTEVIAVLYWPVVTLLSIAFLTTLYHVSVPVRSPWIEALRHGGHLGGELGCGDVGPAPFRGLPGQHHLAGGLFGVGVRDVPERPLLRRHRERRHVHLPHHPAQHPLHGLVRPGRSGDCAG